MRGSAQTPVAAMMAEMAVRANDRLPKPANRPATIGE